MKVEIYSDVVCPWCYIGEQRFKRALQAYAGAEELEVAFRPFQLDPGAAGVPVPLPQALQAKFGARAAGMMQHVGEAARGEGIEIRWSEALSVNTLAAHRLLRWVELEHGPEAQRALAEALFEAHFVQGADVSDAELLSGLAAGVGVDRERARRYLLAGEGTEEVRAEIERAQRLGIRAVPTFVFEGRYMVEGAQPASTLLQVLEEVAAREAGRRTDGDEAASCSDGGCAP